MRRRIRWVALGMLLAGCSGGQATVDHALQRMVVQPKYVAYGKGAFFSDGMAMRRPPAGTVAHNTASVVSPAISPELLALGQSRFQVFCAVCHGVSADGKSVVASNMTERPPPSLRTSKLVQAPPEYLYQVITHGVGRMPPYAAELSVKERWAVVDYLRQLQRAPMERSQ